MDGGLLVEKKRRFDMLEALEEANKADGALTVELSYDIDESTGGRKTAE